MISEEKNREMDEKMEKKSQVDTDVSKPLD